MVELTVYLPEKESEAFLSTAISLGADGFTVDNHPRLGYWKDSDGKEYWDKIRLCTILTDNPQPILDKLPAIRDRLGEKSVLATLRETQAIFV